MKRAILFPGQGAQAVGMGREFADAIPAARELFALADAVLDRPLSKICFEGPEDELTRTDNAQPAIFLCSAAAIVGLEARGSLDRATVQGAAGLSLGEYTALWAAGAFSFEDGLRLVQERGTAMQAASEASPSGMVSLLGADREKAEAVCDLARQDGILVVANLNAPGQVVVSGDREACGRVPAAAKELGLRRAIPLKVAGAFHSPLMEPARARLEAALAGIAIADPRFPVYSNVTAAPVTSAGEVAELLARQVVSPVLWADSMTRMVADGFDDYLEPPPGTVLAGLLKKSVPGAAARALSPEFNDAAEA